MDGQGNCGHVGVAHSGEQLARLRLESEVHGRFGPRRSEPLRHPGTQPPARRRAVGANSEGDRRQAHEPLAWSPSRLRIERRQWLRLDGWARGDRHLHRCQEPELRATHRQAAGADGQSDNRLPTLGREVDRRQARPLLRAAPAPAGGALRARRPLPRTRPPPRDDQSQPAGRRHGGAEPVRDLEARTWTTALLRKRPSRSTTPLAPHQGAPRRAGVRGADREGPPFRASPRVPVTNEGRPPPRGRICTLRPS